MDELQLRHERDQSRFVANADGGVSTLDYMNRGQGVLDYQSTFVPPELRHRGIASKLVKFALDYAREQSFKVVPTCWFVRQFIEQTPEYSDLVAQ